MMRSRLLIDYLQGIIMKFTLENFMTHDFHLGKYAPWSNQFKVCLELIFFLFEGGSEMLV